MEEKDLTLLQQEVTQLRAEGKYKEAIETSYKLLELGMQCGDYKSILTAYINQAASYYCIGDFEAAFNSIAAQEEICDVHGDNTDKLNTYNILFLLHDYNKNYHKAKDTLDKSILLGRKIKKYNIVSNGYSNYSHVFLVEEDYEKALEKGIIAFEVAKLYEPQSPILEFRAKLNIARAHIGLNDLTRSKSLIDEMINESILESFSREKAQCYDLQGHWYLKLGLYREAFDSFTSAKNIVETYHDVYLLKTIQEERCRLCDLMGNISLAYEVQKEYIALLKEISDRELALTALKLDVKRSISSAEKQANRDCLTGIFNRNYLETTTNDWMKQAAGRRESTACIVFDIDGFKLINDTYGHIFGDEIIKQVSKTCKSILGEHVLFGRYGGDEFAVILKEASKEEARQKAVLLLEAVRSLRIEKDGKEISVTISMGVTDNLDCGAVSFVELFNGADLKMYKAKYSGKNQICTVH